MPNIEEHIFSSEDLVLTSDMPAPKKKVKEVNKTDLLRALTGKPDVSESELYAISRGNETNILEILLRDQTRGEEPVQIVESADGKKTEIHTFNHIVWGTDNYQKKYNYYATRQIKVTDIVGKRGRVLRPRALKGKAEQLLRTKQKAEVFTPSWVCNAQNNLVDEAWFGYPNAFNTMNEDHTWIPSAHVKFPEDKRWQDYVTENRLEITCGEAPYLVSRYDTTTGECIPVDQRIGLLDRKFRVIKENLVPSPSAPTTENLRAWREWAYKAIKSTYGFEWQGDSLLIARENILVSFIEYYYDYCNFYHLNAELNTTSIAKAAFYISWNLWQMDGMKYIIPYSDQPEESDGSQICFPDEPKVSYNPNGILAKIAIWKGRGRDDFHDSVEFKELLESHK